MSFEGWKKVRWGDLATLEYGKSLKEYRNSKGIIPVFGTNGQIGFTDKPLCNAAGVIIGRKGAYRGVHYSETPFFVIDTAFYLKPKISQLDIKYAYYELLTQNINDMDSGSAIPSTSREDFYNLSVHLPPFKTQHRIASILSSLDDKIELNRQTNQTLESIAQALFREWFVDFNFPGATGKMQDSELGRIPKDWKIKKIKDVVELIKGVSYRSSELMPSDIALVTLKSINRGGGFNFSGFKEFNGKYKALQELLPGELIFAQTDITQNADVIGSPAIVENPFGYTKLVASIDIVKCKIKDLDISQGFLYALLSLPTFKDYCISHTNGSTVLHLKSSAVYDFKFIMPELDILNKYSKMAMAIRERIMVINLEIQTLTQLRDTLLPKLMKGEISIPETEQQIAAAI